MKKLFTYLRSMISVVLILGLVSCQMAGIVGEREIEDPNLEKKAVFINSIEANKEIILECLHNDPAYGEPGALAKTTAQDSIEAYLNDPEMLYNDLMAEEKGQEYLDFVYVVATNQDTNVLIEKARALITEDEYDSLRSQIDALDTSMVSILQKTSDGYYIDNLAHGFMGAALVTVITTGIYVCIPALAFPAKLATVLAVTISISETVAIGKEIRDYYNYGGSADWLLDIISTTIGSAVGTSIVLGASYLVTSSILSPVVGLIITGVFGFSFLYLGAELGGWI